MRKTELQCELRQIFDCNVYVPRNRLRLLYAFDFRLPAWAIYNLFSSGINDWKVPIGAND
jgi:hypothetical protein